MDLRNISRASKRLALPKWRQHCTPPARRQPNDLPLACRAKVGIVPRQGPTNQTRHQSGVYRPFGNPNESSHQTAPQRSSEPLSFRPPTGNGRGAPDTPPKRYQRPVKPSELNPILLKAINADPNRPVNHEIKAETVTFIDAQGAMKSGQSLQRLIQSIDPLSHVVRRMDIQNGIPIVRIVAVKDIIAEFEEKNKKPTRKKAEGKQLELNWAIDPHDLGHKCRLLKEFLSQGRRVEILLAPKRKGKRATAEESQSVLDTLTATMEGVPNAKEVKPMEGKVGAICKLLFDNPNPVKEEEASEDTQGNKEEKGSQQMSKYERKQQEKDERKRKQEEKLRAAQERTKAKIEQAKADGIPIVEGREAL